MVAAGEAADQLGSAGVLAVEFVGHAGAIAPGDLGALHRQTSGVPSQRGEFLFLGRMGSSILNIGYNMKDNQDAHLVLADHFA